MAVPARPKLRSVETVVVDDATRGRSIVLRDTEGVAPSAIVLPIALASVAARLDGRHTLEEIAAAAGQEVAWVRRLVRELDRALFLESPRFHQRQEEVVRAFEAAPSRPASHAGGAYHDDPAELAQFIERECLAEAAPRRRPGSLRALAAPHMDLWRAKVGYGHAYRALADGLSPEADTFFLLGTSHAAMRRPFAVCRKPFETPLGALEPDHGVVQALARQSRFDVHADEYLHKSEHSLEFQVVFLKHALGARPARIVPILCGLGEAQRRRRDPSGDADAESFLTALAAEVAALGARAVIVAGADLAHVGPRFGDRAALDARGRAALARVDRASIDLTLDRDAAGFFAQVAADLDSRRVCGLGPMYALLRALEGPATAELLHYDQCVDPDEGSVVSHASMAFYA